MAESQQGRLRRIESRHNQLVKELRRAFAQGGRTEDGYCAIESVRIIEEAIRSGLRFGAIFFSESAESRAERLLPQIASHVEAILLPDEVFNSAVATENPQGVAALVRFKEHSFESALAAQNPLIVVVAGIQDPGNLGTIIRSAEAFDVNGIVVGEKTVSVLNPKVIRASAGSIFRVAMLRQEMESAIALLHERGIRRVATSSHKGEPAPQADLTGPLALFIGNEGAGLPRGLLAQMDETVVIPHSDKVESLNAGIAASILLYEISRRRNK